MKLSFLVFYSTCPGGLVWFGFCWFCWLLFYFLFFPFFLLMTVQYDMGKLPKDRAVPSPSTGRRIKNRGETSPPRGLEGFTRAIELGVGR